MKIVTIAAYAAYMLYGVTAVAGMEPADLERVLEVISGEDPGAVVLEVDKKSSWGGGLVSVHTDSGHQWYVRVQGGHVEERERQSVEWEDKQVAQSIAEGAMFLSLPQAYIRVLEELGDGSGYHGVGRGHFSSIEYEVEYRRPTIEVKFALDERELSVYVDPESGEIIMSEWDS